MAPHIIVQYNSSACTNKSGTKETFVLVYVEFNLSKLRFVISISGTHCLWTSIVNPYFNCNIP